MLAIQNSTLCILSTFDRDRKTFGYLYTYPSIILPCCVSKILYSSNNNEQVEDEIDILLLSAIITNTNAGGGHNA